MASRAVPGGAVVLAATLSVLAALRFFPGLGLGGRSAHSLAPSSRTQPVFRVWLDGGGPDVRRSGRFLASAGAEAAACSRCTSRAPRRATLPHDFVRDGSGCSSSRVSRGRGPPGLRPGDRAPVPSARLDDLVGAPDRRGGGPLRRSSVARRGLLGLPASAAPVLEVGRPLRVASPGRLDDLPDPAPLPVRLPVRLAPAVPAPPVDDGRLRRSPPPLTRGAGRPRPVPPLARLPVPAAPGARPVPLVLVRPVPLGRPVPSAAIRTTTAGATGTGTAPAPVPPPDGRAGLPLRAGRADWARRLGRGELGGILGF